MLDPGGNDAVNLVDESVGFLSRHSEHDIRAHSRDFLSGLLQRFGGTVRVV